MPLGSEFAPIFDYFQSFLEVDGKTAGSEFVDGMRGLGGVGCKPLVSGRGSLCDLKLSSVKQDVPMNVVIGSELGDAPRDDISVIIEIPAGYEFDFEQWGKFYFNGWDERERGVRDCVIYKGKIDRVRGRGVFVLINGLKSSRGCVFSTVHVMIRKTSIFPMILR